MNSTADQKIVKYDLQAQDSFSDQFDNLGSKLDVTDAAFKSAMGTTDAWAASAGTTGRAWSDALGKMATGAKNLASEVDKQYQAIESKSKLAAQAIAIGVGVLLAGTIVGALYAVYKVVKETTGFIVGLFSGESYKNKYAEDLLKAANANKELAASLETTTATASAANEALAWTGKTVEQVATLTRTQLTEANLRLQEYHLLLGPKQMEAAEQFATATREFTHNAELTSQGFSRAIGDAVMPLLTDLADFFKDGWPKVVTAFRVGTATLATVAQGFANGIFMITEPILAILSTVGTSIVTVAKAAWQALGGDFLGAKKTLDEGREQIAATWATTLDNMAARSGRTWDAITMAWGADDKGPVGAIKKAAAGVDKEMESLLARLENNAEGVNAVFWKELEKLNKQFASDDPERYLKLVTELINQTKFGADIIRKRNDAEREALAIQKERDGQVQQLAEWIEQRNQELGLVRRLTEGEKRLADVTAGKYDKYGPSVKAANKLAAEEIINKEKLRAATLAAANALDQYTDILIKQTAAQEAALQVGTSLTDQFKRDTDNLQFEISLYGKSTAEIEQLTAARRIDLAVRQAIAQLPIDEEGHSDAAAVLRIIEAGDKAKATTKALLAQNDGLREQYGLWDKVSTSAGNFFGDLVTNGRSAFDNLKQSLRSFVAEIVALFAKRWILQMVAGVTGSSSLAALAGTAGEGSLAASALGGLSSWLAGDGAAGANLWAGAGYGETAPGLGSTIAPFALAALGGYLGGGMGAKWMGAGDRGQKVGGIAGAGGAMLGMAVGGPIGAVIGALAGAIIGKFTDPDGLANRTGDFGGGRSNYWWGGGKSAFGSFGVTNDKWFSDNDMLAKVQEFEKGLGAAEDALAKFLSADEIKRVTGALANSKNYSFGTEHGDFASTLGQILSDRINAIVAAVDPALSKWLDGFTGTGEELANFANQLLGVRQALADPAIADILARIPDATIDGLMAMKAAGESLGETFQRVVGEFITAQNNLNQAIAQRNPQFARDLVLGQRNNIGVQFAELIGQQYGADLATQMALNPQSFTGLSANGMTLLAQWLGLQTTLEQLDAQLANAGNTVVDTFTNVSTSVNNFAETLLNARTGLADYLRGSITSDASPLAPKEQYLLAKQQFNDQLALARTNDPEAISGITSYFENMIRLSRMVNGSDGNYNVDYFTGYNALAGLTGGQVQPYTNQTAMTLHSQQMAVMVEVREEIRASKEATIALATFLAEQGITVRSPEIVEAIEANAVTTGGDGYLQSTRTGGLG